MLPKKFTLRQLQSLHEVVLNKKLDERNFRKNVKRMDHVVPLNEKEEGVLTSHAAFHSMQTLPQINPDFCLRNTLHTLHHF